MMAGANVLTARATNRRLTGSLTPVGQFRAFLHAFDRLGYDVNRLLGESGVRRSDIDQPDAFLPPETCAAFFARALQERPLKNLGVRLAAVTPLGAFPLLDYLVLSSEDVGDAFSQLARHLRVTGAPFVLEVHDDEDPIRVVYLDACAQAAWGIEYSLTLNVLHLRQETEERVRFAWVSFTHRPDDVSEIETVLKCPVRSGAPWAGLAVPRDAWRVPLRRRDPILRSLLELQAETMAVAGPGPDRVVLDLRRVLASRLPRGELAIDVVARDLGMSARTLQRRLSAAGSSYQEVLDSSRREMAERCLAGSSLSVAEIAYMLAFSEPAAFHRAFKRWAGMTPQAFRRDRREAGALAAHGHQPGGLELRSGDTPSRG
jgi:AraC-like DNA-binding protein